VWAHKDQNTINASPTKNLGRRPQALYISRLFK